ncbi:uncharacterized protein [Drosophila tropicalis]|uniref:uncharacterized protein n=1 Tax=Drosophila tropicalis TaxID=46794 RepID=UPI0035AC0D66
MNSKKSITFIKKLIETMHSSDFEDREGQTRSRSRSSSSHAVREEGGGNRKVLNQLNQEFDQDIVRLEHSICSLDFREKSMATAWIAKLKTTQRNVHEARARNQILAYILKCVNENVFNHEPFNKPPPSLSLSTIKATLHLTHDTTCMATASQQEKNKYLSELFNNCYDAGDFLSQLPVPRDGAFFVLHMHPNLQ